MVSRQPARPVTGKAVLSVGFVLTNNFTLTTLSSFLDALRLAADDGDGSRPIRCHWKILGARREFYGVSPSGVRSVSPEPVGEAIDWRAEKTIRK